jgi:hypothetical protein
MKAPFAYCCDSLSFLGGRVNLQWQEHSQQKQTHEPYVGMPVVSHFEFSSRIEGGPVSLLPQ